MLVLVTVLFGEVHGAVKLVHHLLPLFLYLFIVFLFDFLHFFLGLGFGKIFEDI